MDVIAYHQAELTWAVAPLGTALTEEQLKILKPFADTIYLSFDNDAAGIKATRRAILMTRKLDFNVRIVMLSGGKDPSEILNEKGKDALTKHIENAILDSDFLLSVLSKEYNIGTPEGKARASLEFFEYIDVLPSDIQKESCLEQLCQTYQLKPEAVKADFENRSSVLKNIETTNRQPDQGVVKQSTNSTRKLGQCWLSFLIPVISTLCGILSQLMTLMMPQLVICLFLLKSALGTMHPNP